MTNTKAEERDWRIRNAEQAIRARQDVDGSITAANAAALIQDVRKLVISEIGDERTRQDLKWGGPGHDDQHSVHDFVRFIRNYAGWAEQMADSGSLEKARRRLVQVAALAVACVEAIDRAVDRPAARMAARLRDTETGGQD